MAAGKRCSPQHHEPAQWLQKVGAVATVRPTPPPSQIILFSLFIFLWLFEMFPRRGKQ